MIPVLCDARQLNAFLAACTDAAWSVDARGVISLWNAAAQALFEYSKSEMIGQNVTILWPDAREPSEPDEAKTLVAKSGKRISVLLNSAPLRDENGERNGAIFRAGALEKSENEPSRENEPLSARDRDRALVLETANRVALDILSNRQGVEALRHIADAARILAGARYAALGVANVDGDGLREFITVGLTPEQEAKIGTLPSGKGVLGLLLHRTTPLRVDVLANDAASVGFPENHPPMDSFLGVPIRRGETVLGSLYLTNKQGGGVFTASDEVAVEALGAHAAVAIHHLQTMSRQRDLVRGLMNAQDEERRAVAYDLHDGLTQFVMASHAHLQSFERAQKSGNLEKAQSEFAHASKLLQDAVVESRRLVNGLRALALDDLGLAGALEVLLHDEKARNDWQQAEVEHNIAGRRFDRAFETGAYRIAQEALTNVRKHARTSRVQISAHLNERSQTLQLQIRDWGQGFSLDQRSDEIGGVGLQGMIERAHLLGGKLEVRSEIGAGTIVQATLPVLDVVLNDEAPA